MTDTHFVIGDVQGQHTLLKRLLRQEGLLDDEGKRLRPEVQVISLGDLMHFARYPMGTQYINEEDDWECFKLLQDGVIDLMLWGNHDRPMMGHLGNYTFSGFTWPNNQFVLAMKNQRAAGKIKLAEKAGNFLLTHAGLHSNWAETGITDIQEIVDTLNAYDTWRFDEVEDGQDANDPDDPRNIFNWIEGIGRVRGGFGPHGGILWRDNNDESLWGGVRQIYGHTAYPTPQAQASSIGGDSYCIDVSKADRIGAIWLPSERIVTMGMDDEDSSNHSLCSVIDSENPNTTD